MAVATYVRHRRHACLLRTAQPRRALGGEGGGPGWPVMAHGGAPVTRTGGLRPAAGGEVKVPDPNGNTVLSGSRSGRRVGDRLGRGRGASSGSLSGGRGAGVRAGRRPAGPPGPRPGWPTLPVPGGGEAGRRRQDRNTTRLSKTRGDPLDHPSAKPSKPTEPDLPK